ncbi:MAG: TetR/AcrR family transcriptional regulator [Acidobacteriota bacterium]
MSRANDITTRPAGLGFDPPKQERSEETCRRILEAADRILRDQSFEETSIAQIVARAGCSEGPFYARFGDKEKFLRHLEEHFFAEGEKAVRAVECRGAVAGSDAEQAVRESLRFVIREYRRLQGIHGALVLRSRRDRELRVRLAALDRDHLARVSRCLAGALGRRGRRADDVASFGLFVVRSAVRQAILFGDSWRAAGDDGDRDDALADGLASLLVGYLQASARP